MTTIRYGNAVKATDQEMKVFGWEMAPVPLEHLRYRNGVEVEGWDNIVLPITLDHVGEIPGKDELHCNDIYKSDSPRSFGCQVFLDAKTRHTWGPKFEIRGADVLGPDSLGKYYLGDIDGNGIYDIAIQAKDGAIYVFHGLPAK